MKLSEALSQWYLENQRPLPFRESRDPYAIWVSEIMAQQTRIDSMIPYYLRWIEQWPTVEALAQAPLQDVLQLWQGLGYYNRARKLHQGAQLVVEKYGGKLPDDQKVLQTIPGIGAYTAGAIASIAFGKRAPAVDGNVLRVTARILEMEEDITKKTTVDRVSQQVYEWMEDCDPSVFTQGLMEIGALICTFKKPSCLLCPLSSFCQSFARGTMEQYPIKKSAKKPQELQVYTFLIRNRKNQILLSEDHSDGLMEGLLRLPQYAQIPESLKTAVFVENRKHVFSHRIWRMACYQLECEDVVLEKTHWVDCDQLDSIALVTAHRKWLKKMMEAKQHEQN